MQQQHFEFIHDNVDGKEILIQMDFPEHFTITEQNVLQSKHWKTFNIHCSFASAYLVHGKFAVHKLVLITLEYVQKIMDI